MFSTAILISSLFLTINFCFEKRSPSNQLHSPTFDATVMFLHVALLGLLSMVSATVDRITVDPSSLADYDYSLRIENHTVSAVLANGTVIHDGSDPCTSSTTFTVGKDYLEADCPAPIKFMNADGLCDVTKAQDTTHPCQAFCQVRTTYSYEREVPWGVHHEKDYAASYCHYKAICSFSPANMPISSSYDYASLNEVYNQGISGGWHSGAGQISNSGRINLNQDLKDNECGYWTSIVVKKRVCGSTSISIVNQDVGFSNCLHDKIWETMTYGSVCVDQNPQNKAGTSYVVAAVTVFVKVKCWDFTLLSPSSQEEPYNKLENKLSTRDLGQLMKTFMDFSCESYPAWWFGAPYLVVSGRGLPTNLLGDDGTILWDSLYKICLIPWLRWASGWTFEWKSKWSASELWNRYEWTAKIPVSSYWRGNEQGAYQCYLDWIRDQGGPSKNYDKDCTKH
ncbi:uncharacterized protein PG998_007767 [Apiospora kogelbergensis]|uniref:uncharacterized protein n=1 Tax=Apiospora kogelbergensis TaxID=1337665 RepID=UPI00313174BC